MRVMRVIADNFPTRRGKCQRQKYIYGLKVPRHYPHHPQTQTIDGSSPQLSPAGNSHRVDPLGTGN